MTETAINILSDISGICIWVERGTGENVRESKCHLDVLMHIGLIKVSANCHLVILMHIGLIKVSSNCHRVVSMHNGLIKVRFNDDILTLE